MSDRNYPAGSRSPAEESVSSRPVLAFHAPWSSPGSGRDLPKPATPSTYPPLPFIWLQLLSNGFRVLNKLFNLPK